MGALLLGFQRPAANGRLPFSFLRVYRREFNTLTATATWGAASGPLRAQYGGTTPEFRACGDLSARSSSALAAACLGEGGGRIRAQPRHSPVAGESQLAMVCIGIPPTSPWPGGVQSVEGDRQLATIHKDGTDPAAAFVPRKKVQQAKKNIRDAFLDVLYHGLDLLKKSRMMVDALSRSCDVLQFRHLHIHHQPSPSLLYAINTWLD